MPIQTPLFSGGVQNNGKALRNELVLDPLGLGYSGSLSQSDYITVSNLMNQTIAGASGNIWRNDIAPREIVAAITPLSFSGLSQLQINQLNLLFAGQPIDATNSGTRQNFQAVFFGTSNSGTINNLTTLANRQGSRCEVMFGPGTFVTDTDVRNAWGRASGQ